MWFNEGYDTLTKHVSGKFDCIAWSTYRRVGAVVYGVYKYPICRLWHELRFFWKREWESLLELLVHKVIDEVGRLVQK